MFSHSATAVPLTVKPQRKSSRDAREIVLVGRVDSDSAIKRALSKLDATIRQVSDTVSAQSIITPSTRAVVLVDLAPGLDALQAAQQLEGAASVSGIPTFVVVPEAYPDRRAHKLYEAGVAAVFEWPYEALIVPDMLTELAGAAPIDGDDDVDAPLERAVRARLELSDITGEDVSVHVRSSTAVLSGTVASYWKRHRLVDALDHVPGVTGVVAEDVDVVPPERPDHDLLRDLRNALQSAARIDPRTVSVSVQRGAVSVAGSVSSHGDLERIVRVIGNVEGVRSVRNMLTVSPEVTERSRSLAQRLCTSVETLWSRASARVSVFGHVAVLTGHVRTLADKRGIERHVLDVPGIGRVVNKLRVVAQPCERSERS